MNHAGLWPAWLCWDAQAPLWVLLIPWPGLGIISHAGRRRKSRSNLFTNSLPSLLELLFITPVPRKATGPLFIGTVWCVWLLIICFPKYPILVWFWLCCCRKASTFSEIQYSSSFRCVMEGCQSILCVSELEGGDFLFIPFLFFLWNRLVRRRHTGAKAVNEWPCQHLRRSQQQQGMAPQLAKVDPYLGKQGKLLDKIVGRGLATAAEWAVANVLSQPRDLLQHSVSPRGALWVHRRRLWFLQLCLC